MSFENDIVESLKVLRNGGIILYPTDTIWELGAMPPMKKLFNESIN